MVSYHFSMYCNARAGTRMMRDLKSRLDEVPNLAADKLEAYRIAVDRVYGRRTRLRKLRQSKGDGALSIVERHNGTIRTFNKRYSRRTLAFSKRRGPHLASMDLLAVYNDFCWIHGFLDVTPAKEVGIDDQLRDMEWIAGLIDANAPPPRKPVPKVGTKYRPRKK